MITQMFFLALLLLGHTQGNTITFQTKELPSISFENKFDPGFEVTGAKLNQNDLAKCQSTATVTEQATVCYKQGVESTVHFVIEDTTGYKEIEFKGTADTDKKTVQIADFTQQRANTKLDTNYGPLEFVPTQMVVKPTSQPGGPVGAAKESATELTILVSDGCPGTTGKKGCIEVSKIAHPLTLFAEWTSDRQVLTLTSAETKEFKATFYQGSTAWLSYSAALMLSNLAIVYLAY